MIHVFISCNFDEFPRVFKRSQSGLATRKRMSDTLHKEEKAQKVTARHSHGKMDGKEKAAWATENLDLERIEKWTHLYNLRQIHKDWTWSWCFNHAHMDPGQESVLLFIWRPRSQSLEEEWRCTESELLEVWSKVFSRWWFGAMSDDAALNFMRSKVSSVYWEILEDFHFLLTPHHRLAFRLHCMAAAIHAKETPATYWVLHCSDFSEVQHSFLKNLSFFGCLYLYISSVLLSG